MNVKLKIIRQTYQSADYNIFTFFPIDTTLPVHPKFRSVSLKGGNLSFLTVGNVYTLDIESVDDYSYQLSSMPQIDVSTLSYNEKLSILTECTSEKLANEMLTNYPDIISMIVNNKIDMIDVSKLHGIKKKLLAKISNNIKSKYSYCIIQQQFKQYYLSFSDAKLLSEKYGAMQEIEHRINQNPYIILIDDLDKSFERVDTLLKTLRPDLLHSDIRAEYAIIYVLNSNELSGSTYMIANDMAKKINDFAPEIVSKLKEVCISSEKIYYNSDKNIVAKMSTYLCEKNIAEFIKNKLCVVNVQKLDENDSFSHIKNEKSVINQWNFNYIKYKQIDDIELTDEQIGILKSVCENNIIIINALAGSGKTQSLKAVVQMCEDNNKSYCLVAPTGKVAKRVQELTGHQASTIHRRVLECPITEDIVICEEFSMVSIDLLWLLLSSIDNPNAKLLFVGDLNQISPIGIGCPMKDMVDSGLIPVCSLSKVFRFNEGGLSKISCLVHDGINYLDGFNGERIDFGTKKDYTFVQSDNTAAQVVNEYAALLASYSPDDITVVTPWNISPLGSIAINNTIQQLVNPVNDKFIKYKYRQQEIKFHKNDIVLNTKNDYHVMCDDYENECAIFNGETGHIIELTDDDDMIVQFDDRRVIFNKDNIKHLLLGYCVNSYKLQGSQNKAIIVITNKQHEEYLNKNIMYTNLTRAEEKLIEIGTLTTISKCVKINTTDQRNTQLKEMLIK